MALLLFWSLAGRASAQSAPEMLQKGIGALKAQDFQLAQRIFAKLVEQDPSGANIGYLGIAEFSA